MQTSRIEDVTEFVLDGTHGSPERTESGIPVLSAQNVKNGRLMLETERFTSEAEYEKFQSHLPLSKGDVLLTIVGTIGRAAVVEDVQPLVFQRSVAVLRPKNDCLDSRFLFHVIQSREFQAQLTRSVNKSSQAGVYLGKLKKLFVPLPPLTKQQRIADILDRAEALRAKRRAALAQLDELVQSIFIEMFGNPATNPKGWKNVLLGKCTLKIGSGATPTGGEAAYKKYGISLIRSLNVRDGEFSYKDLAFIDKRQARKLSNVQVEENDVLLNITGASVARVCRPPKTVLPARVNQHVSIIRPNSNLDPIFLEQLLLSPSTKIKLLRISGSGATREAITKAQLEEFEVIYPPLPLQQEFARRVVTLKKLKTANRTSLAELDKLFASLQYRAFRGEL